MKINNVKLHYEIAGEGEAIILGHAGFVDSRMWDAQWTVLTEHYRVIRFDMQGYGQSDLATQSMSRSEELFRLMTHLDINKAHLVGSSLSGAAYIDFVLTYPEKCLSLTLVNTVPNGFEMQGEPPRYMMEMFGALQANNVDTASELQTRIWFDGESREPEDVNNNLRQKVASMNKIAVQNRTFLIAEMQEVNPLSPPANTRLQDIHCPTLVIDSTLDNPEITRAAQWMKKHIPNVKYHTINDAAHVPNMEQPEIFNQILLDFLASQ